MKITLALQSIDSFLVGSGLEDSNGTLAIDMRPGMVSMPETVYLLCIILRYIKFRGCSAVHCMA